MGKRQSRSFLRQEPRLQADQESSLRGHSTTMQQHDNHVDVPLPRTRTVPRVTSTWTIASTPLLLKLWLWLWLLSVLLHGPSPVHAWQLRKRPTTAITTTARMAQTLSFLEPTMTTFWTDPIKSSAATTTSTTTSRSTTATMSTTTASTPQMWFPPRHAVLPKQSSWIRLSSGKQRSWTTTLTFNTEPNPGRTTTVQQQQQQQSYNYPSRARGTLGFDIPKDYATTGTALHSTRVDSSAWNGARTWHLGDEDDENNEEEEDYDQEERHVDHGSNDNNSETNTRKRNVARNKQNIQNHMNSPTTATSSSSPHRRRRRLLWSNYAPDYNVMLRVKSERTDLNIDDWQQDLIMQHTTLQQQVALPKNPPQQQRQEKKSEVSRRKTSNQGSNDHHHHHHPENSKDNKEQQIQPHTGTSTTVNSLAEWVRTVDLEPLLQRREEIHREKQTGKRSQRAKSSSTSSSTTMPQNTNVTRQDLVQSLTKLLDSSSNTRYSNYEVKQMYAAAKLADQQGQLDVAKQILTQLLEATPSDMRLYRRLARMENQQGNVERARAILQQGLRVNPKNAYLWHGLGQLASTDADAKKAYRRAIRCDPSVPHAHHALGTLEHSQGRIANAMQTLQAGIVYCPTNHRLHHALGDLYREAKMLDMAEKSYQRAMRHGPESSRPFCYTALAYCAYDRGQFAASRQWLTKATQFQEGRNVNAWKSLALLEEALGNTEAARKVCQTALDNYETKVLARFKRPVVNESHSDRAKIGKTAISTMTATDSAISIKNALLQKVPVYRSGDRFYQLYRTWTRLEEWYGTTESVLAVYERATAAFPKNRALVLDWADFFVKRGLPDNARQVLRQACGKMVHGDLFARYAEFEMSLGNHETARKILFTGALRLSQGVADVEGMAELYHTWAVCEWHLGNLERAEVLLDHALRLTPAGADGATLRAVLLYTLARLQYFRGEYLLAQHCVALCLKENIGGTAKLWDLWAAVAAASNNDSLQAQCIAQAARARALQDNQVLVSMMLHGSKPTDTCGGSFQDLVRLDPWHHDIFGSSSSADSSTTGKDSPFAYGVKFPPIEDNGEDEGFLKA